MAEIKLKKRYKYAGDIMPKLLDIGFDLETASDFLNNIPDADVAPREEGGAECPICHGTGRIGTTDWLTKHLSEKQLAEEKAKAIAEHEQHIKAKVAREIFEEIERYMMDFTDVTHTAYKHIGTATFAHLKKKYTEEQTNGN